LAKISGRSRAPTYAEAPVTVSAAETGGGIRDWIDILEAERTRSDGVRFRLHRFGGPPR